MAGENDQTELNVITSGAFAAALEALVPVFIQKHPIRVAIHYGSSLGAAHDSIPTRLKNGERFDLYFMARDAVDQFTAEGYIRPDYGIDLVESYIGAAVRVGDPAPDISTPEALRATLLASKSIAHAASVSGIYISTELFPALGIDEEMKKTARPIFSERVGTILARGEADLGFQQVSELLPIAGVKVIGRLPKPYQHCYRFCVAMGVETKKVDAAKQLMRFVASQEAAPAIRKTGLEPLFPEIG